MRTRTLALIAAATLLLTFAQPPARADDGTIVRQLRWSRIAAEAAGTYVEGGHATISPSRQGVAVTVDTVGLLPGHSYTMWVEFFNHPELCVMPLGDEYRCGALDFANPAVGAAARYGTGVASVGEDGTQHLEAFIPADTLPTTVPDLLAYTAFRLQTGSPIDLPNDEKHLSSGTALLTNPLGAEYQVMILDHGPYDPGRFGDAQWTTHSGGCHIEEGNVWPYLGGPCAMAQAAGFPAYPPFTLLAELENHV